MAERGVYIRTVTSEALCDYAFVGGTPGRSTRRTEQGMGLRRMYVTLTRAVSGLIVTRSTRLRAGPSRLRRRLGVRPGGRPIVADPDTFAY
ncbi:hypothetical protein GCM10022232_64390 [Streptomyces plumbiresistens]|uniref:UvrD-like helicase C-terminal domain-containing protein n=1 Tax=Streptomyces plumbiresistens TaxID=511811 RepID=A0ABP7SL31_9ACTN